MNKRKLLTLAMTLCMVAILAIGGTLAYFTDTEKATNIMTIGNVEINIDEFQKNEDGTWEPFEDTEFTLYPVDWNVGTKYRNKIAYTANVSPSEDDAYIRTIVLFEKNDVLTDGYKAQSDCCVPGLHFNYFEDAEAVSVANGKTIHGAKTTNLNQVINYNNNEYHVVVFEEVSGLAVPYDEALFSLNGVFMDKNITSEQITGWGTDGVEIIVFSQAIQATGLTYEQAMKELGEINETNLNNWLNGYTVSGTPVAAAPEATINDWN